MPQIIAIEYSESQRRQLNEKLRELSQKGWPLTGRYEAQSFGSWEKLFETAITPGLFATREAIVVEGAETLGVFPESLAGFVEDNADCVLILIFNDDAKNIKAIRNSITVIKPEAQIPPWDRPKWLMTLAKERNFTIDYDAAQLLADSVESQEELRSEIEKFAMYSEGRAIKLEDVENLSFDEGGRSQLIFLDGVCANNVADVARALRYLRNSPLLPTLTALTNRLRPALMLSCFHNKYSDEVLKILGTKNYAAKKAQSALKNFGADRIKIFMAKAARLSYLEKTNVSEGWQGFELIIWELMTKM
ncbi:MAG: hypothetical protein IJU31_06300 [Synergistaceae bacterium]|nr:hypothetical protein [Synergistaceae bacterium]